MVGHKWEWLCMRDDSDAGDDDDDDGGGDDDDDDAVSWENMDGD